MKKIFYFILALFILPFYPLLKRFKSMNEKMQFGEKVIVVTVNKNKRKTIIE